MIKLVEVVGWKTVNRFYEDEGKIFIDVYRKIATSGTSWSLATVLCGIEKNDFDEYRKFYDMYRSSSGRIGKIINNVDLLCDAGLLRVYPLIPGSHPGIDEFWWDVADTAQIASLWRTLIPKFNEERISVLKMLATLENKGPVRGEQCPKCGARPQFHRMSLICPNCKTFCGGC